MGNKKDWVFMAKGLGIILVVIGHFYPDGSPYYWSMARRIIYTFHMPLFFILSGYLFNYNKYPFPKIIKKKFKRLIYPFLSISIIFFLVKYYAGFFFNLQHPVGIRSVYSLLTDPINSYIPLLWFVHALFIIFIVYSLIRTILNNNFIILIIFLAVNIVIGSNYAFLGNAVHNIPYFIIGNILRGKNKLNKIISGKLFCISIVFVIFLISFFIKNKYDFHHNYLLSLISGITGSIFIFDISKSIDLNTKAFNIARIILIEIGLYSMTIYLFHTLFESAVRIGCYQLLNNFGISFEIAAVTAVLSGITFPLLLEKYVLGTNQLTKKYILGLA